MRTAIVFAALTRIIAISPFSIAAGHPGADARYGAEPRPRACGGAGAHAGTEPDPGAAGDPGADPGPLYQAAGVTG